MIRLLCVSKLSQSDIKIIDNFVVLMYDALWPHKRVNNCLKYLFSKLNRTIDQCPSTKDALEQHILRAILQSYIWSKSTQLKEESIAVTDRDGMLTSGGMSIHCGQHYRKLWRHAKSWKIASAKPCAHVTRVLVKPMPYNALSFANMTVFARTDTTSSMMRFAKRGHSETCFSTDCTYINRPIYILGTFLLAIYTSSDILHAFFQSFSLPTYNFHQYFRETNFLWNSLRATFNPGFGYIQLQTLMFLFNSLDEDFKCLFSTHIPIIWQ